MRHISLLIVAATLVACGSGTAGEHAPAQETPESVAPGETQPQLTCDAKAGDSAYAVCWATRPDRVGGRPRRVYEVVRHADTVCVTTLPGDPRTPDGMRRTKVLFTAVVENLESDSVGCH
jgi:hypothetical protein